MTSSYSFNACAADVDFDRIFKEAKKDVVQVELSLPFEDGRYSLLLVKKSLYFVMCDYPDSSGLKKQGFKEIQYSPKEYVFKPLYRGKKQCKYVFLSMTLAEFENYYRCFINKLKLESFKVTGFNIEELLNRGE